MKVIFKIEGWRDAAFSPCSEDGSGTYIVDRTMEIEVKSMIALIRDQCIIISETNTLYFEIDDVKYIEDYAIVSGCIDTFNSYRDFNIEDLDEFEDLDDSY